jgi:MOSC domain-containing protein YiiM
VSTEGTVEQIAIAAEHPQLPVPVPSVRAEAGHGLAGEYHWSETPEPGQSLTLIAAEALEGLREDTGIELTGQDTRRNVLTRGIDLNALVGQRFTVGEVEAVGVELSEPCTKLQRLTEEKGVLRGLVHRGGLRADVVGGGRIAIGDPVSAADGPR